ncbi:MAG: hypothetical protein ON057_000114 [Glomeribacter sp. 1016415]|nr:hypothetical protein [Glomeribacter sp. 1016415]
MPPLSPILRRQSQKPSTESNDLGSNTIEQTIPRKRTVYLEALKKFRIDTKNLNPEPQRERKRRGVRPTPQKETIQSGVAPDHGLGVEIVTSDNPEKVSSQLSYSDMQYQAFYQPIEAFFSQPGVSNALDGEDISLEFLTYLQFDDPESQNAEMNLAGEPEANHAALSDNDFQAIESGVGIGTSDNQDEAGSSLSFYDQQLRALNHPIDFCRQSDVLNALGEEDSFLDFLDEWNLDNENAVSGNQNAVMSSEGESEANHAAPSVNDFQAVEKNTGQQAKLKKAKHVKWADKFEEIANNIVKANTNVDPKLSGIKLHARLKAWCNDQTPPLTCPTYDCFNRNYLVRSYKHYKWPLELIAVTHSVINKYPKLGYRRQYKKFMKEIEENYSSKTPPTLKNFRTFIEKMKKSASVIEN